MTTAPTFSADLLQWARRAGYALTPSDSSGAAILWSDPGGETRYYTRQGDDGWLMLTRASRGGGEQFTLRASSMGVLERYLFGVLGDVIRDDEGLPILRSPWAESDVAVGYNLSPISEDGFMTLRRADSTALAVAQGKTTGLLELVPLSQYLRLNISELKDSFLSEDGAPLMSGESYTRTNNQ